MNFKNLHHRAEPLLIANVWDIASAKVAKGLGFQAIGTSSGAIATMLGYEDGEEISFPELKYIVERIVKNVELPLSADLEAGYGLNADEIVRNILEMYKLGVVGFNIEDSRVINEQRSLLNSSDFGELLEGITTQLKPDGHNLFINVRTDAYLLGMESALEETKLRAEKYQKAGADGLFVPCIEKQEDIENVIMSTELPLNVMCVPNLPEFNTLRKLGVKRISMGNFVYNRMNNELKATLEKIRSNQSFASLF